MSQENVEIVRRVSEAWARNELPGPARLFDAQIEYVNPPDAVEPGIRHGLVAFTRAVRDAFEGQGAWQIEPEEFMWTVRDGKVVRYEWFHGPKDALEAMGLG
jgi:ketosteroid isomerase-like protein